MDYRENVGKWGRRIQSLTRWSHIDSEVIPIALGEDRAMYDVTNPSILTHAILQLTHAGHIVISQDAWYYQGEP